MAWAQLLQSRHHSQQGQQWVLAKQVIARGATGERSAPVRHFSHVF
jgi:hypothetical protein